jgi:hypothetical protein
MLHKKTMQPSDDSHLLASLQKRVRRLPLEEKLALLSGLQALIVGEKSQAAAKKPLSVKSGREVVRSQQVGHPFINLSRCAAVKQAATVPPGSCTAPMSIVITGKEAN